MERVRSHNGVWATEVPDLVLYYDSTNSESGNKITVRHWSSENAELTRPAL
jgi:hypothetical protein